MAELKDLVAIRRALTDHKAKLTSEYNAAVDKITSALVDTEAQIRSSMNKAGLKSARTDAGTVTLKTSTKYQVSDWQAVDQLVKDTDDTSFYQRRLSSTRFRQWLDEDNEMPEGITSVDVIDISVTKPTSK